MTRVADENTPGFFADVAPDDDVLIQNRSWIRVGGAGNLVLKGWNSDTVTLAVAAGEYVPFRSGYIMEATTATGLVLFG